VSIALARKYRPATFDDLIGQEAVSQTLSLALDGDRLSHAYLFSGLRGSGKTSTARIFAKALLCEKGATSHPCGTCTHCSMAAQNSHMDIIEMDAASNRGIDDIKDLIEHTKYKPSSARYKIFIIDEVHMLTNQAFNALLKTLEEPPDFVKFILATTDPLKLPATILSRTQHFRFKKIPQNLVRGHLEHILHLEKIEYEVDALEILARSGAGSLRDSLTLLDQAIVYSKNFVDVNTVTGMLGIIEPSLLEKLLINIYNKDTNEILDFVRLASDYEAEMILDELTLHLKGLLLSGNTTFTPMIIERFFRVMAESKALLSLGSDGEFVLTLSLFKMMEALEIKDLDAMIRGLEKELSGVSVSEIMATPPAPQLASAQDAVGIKQDETATSLPPQKLPEPSSAVEEISVDIAPVQVTPEAEEVVAVAIKPEPVQVASINIVSSQEATPVVVKEIIPPIPQVDLCSKIFDELVKKIYDRSHDLGALFENNITFVSFEENKLTWESTAEDEDKKQLITHWGVINMFVKELFGFETKIVNISKKKVADASKEAVNKSSKEKNLTEPSINDEIQMKSSCIAPEAGNTEAAKEKDPSALLAEPMVKEAIALFDPKKVRIKRNS
jgi:DNA polymerase-3 subunit gamma/tau